MSNLVERELIRRREEQEYIRKVQMRPKTLREPDNDTFWCTIKSKRFTVDCCKILCAYANGDCTVLTLNGVQFTARAEEIFHIRKGDYHASPDL
jgi:hypothetical protein